MSLGGNAQRGQVVNDIVGCLISLEPIRGVKEGHEICPVVWNRCHRVSKHLRPTNIVDCIHQALHVMVDIAYLSFKKCILPLKVT